MYCWARTRRNHASPVRRDGFQVFLDIGHRDTAARSPPAHVPARYPRRSTCRQAPSRYGRGIVQQHPGGLETLGLEVYERSSFRLPTRHEYPSHCHPVECGGSHRMHSRGIIAGPRDCDLLPVRIGNPRSARRNRHIEAPSAGLRSTYRPSGIQIPEERKKHYKSFDWTRGGGVALHPRPCAAAPADRCQGWPPASSACGSSPPSFDGIQRSEARMCVTARLAPRAR